MMRGLLLAAASVFTAAGCAVTDAEPRSSSTEDPASTLSALMTGTFQTAPDDPDNTIRDRRVPVTSTNLDGVWLYYQLNTGEDWDVYRQRVVELATDGDSGGVVQKTYGLKKPGRFVDAWDNPALLSSITYDDIEPFFDEGCEQRWTLSAEDGWHGYVDPETCKIFSERRQSHISIEAEARLDAEIYRQTERGYDDAGNKLFGTEPGEFIVLYRQ